MHFDKMASFSSWFEGNFRVEAVQGRNAVRDEPLESGSLLVAQNEDNARIALVARLKLSNLRRICGNCTKTKRLGI